MPNLFIMYATSEGNIARAGNAKEPSPFTKCLFEQMTNNPGLKIEELSKIVRISLAQLTSDKQISWDASGLMCSFQFT